MDAFQTLLLSAPAPRALWSPQGSEFFLELCDTSLAPCLVSSSLPEGQRESCLSFPGCPMLSHLLVPLLKLLPSAHSSLPFSQSYFLGFPFSLGPALCVLHEKPSEVL